MDMEQIDVLEKKINQAVELIGQLKAENQGFKSRVQELERDTQSKEMQIQELMEQKQQLEEMHSESSLNEERDKRIRSKVEQMLTRLDELES